MTGISWGYDIFFAVAYNGNESVHFRLPQILSIFSMNDPVWMGIIDHIFRRLMPPVWPDPKFPRVRETPHKYWWLQYIFKGWRPSSAPPDFSTLHFMAVWAWKLLDGDLLQKYICLCFLKKVHGIGPLLEIDGFFGEQVSSRKLLPRVCPEQLLPISTGYFV